MLGLAMQLHQTESVREALRIRSAEERARSEKGASGEGTPHCGLHQSQVPYPVFPVAAPPPRAAPSRYVRPHRNPTGILLRRAPTGVLSGFHWDPDLILV